MALDHIGTGGGIGLMDRRDPTRAADHQLLQTLFTACALGIEHRAHTTITEQRPLLQFL